MRISKADRLGSLRGMIGWPTLSKLATTAIASPATATWRSHREQSMDSNLPIPLEPGRQVSSREEVSPGAGARGPDWERLVLDLLPTGLIWIDDDLVVRGANAAAHDLLSRPPGTMTGKSTRKILNLREDSASDERYEIEIDIGNSVHSKSSRRVARLLSVQRGEPPYDVLEVEITPVAEASRNLGVLVQIARVEDPEEVARRRHRVETVLSLVSHELRTPLLHIKGFISSLLEQDVKWDAESQLDFLRTVDREADRLSTIVNDLLEISRLGSLEPSLDLEKMDPRMLAFTGFDEATPFLSRHRVDLDVPEGLPMIRVDRIRMTSVFVNLLENAVKYSPEGTVITVTGGSEAGFITFCVSDEGPGVPAELRERVFDLFFRVPQLRDRRGTGRTQGSGLGLAVCRSVVEAHGGHIWIDSAEGGGATFCFTVPIPSRQ